MAKRKTHRPTYQSRENLYAVGSPRSNTKTNIVEHITVVDAVFRGATQGGYMHRTDDLGYNMLTVWDLGVDEHLYPRTEKQVINFKFSVDKRQYVVESARNLALAFGEDTIFQEIAYYDTPNLDIPIPRFVVRNGELIPLGNEVTLALFNDIVKEHWDI